MPFLPFYKRSSHVSFSDARRLNFSDNLEVEKNPPNHPPLLDAFIRSYGGVWIRSGEESAGAKTFTAVRFVKNNSVASSEAWSYVSWVEYIVNGGGDCPTTYSFGFSTTSSIMGKIFNVSLAIFAATGYEFPYEIFLV